MSTGALPDPEAVAALVAAAYLRYVGYDEGVNSSVYPALAEMPSHLFGVCVAGVNGRMHGAGDTAAEFTLMSVTKPFVFALVAEALGPKVAGEHVGVNATGLPFNSIEAIHRVTDGRTNPMVNPGAIAATSLVPGSSADARWRTIHRGLSDFAGRDLQIDEAMYASASATNHRNRQIAVLLARHGRLGCEPDEALDLYTRQCSLRVTVSELAVMGATLGDGGMNPVSRCQVVSPDSARAALATMTTAGLYETSGDWLYSVGLPGKSGISGAIVTISPGKGGLGTFAPRLDAAGNSFKGQLAARFLSHHLGLDIFRSHPA